MSTASGNIHPEGEEGRALDQEKREHTMPDGTTVALPTMIRHRSNIFAAGPMEEAEEDGWMSEDEDRDDSDHVPEHPKMTQIASGDGKEEAFKKATEFLKNNGLVLKRVRTKLEEERSGETTLQQTQPEGQVGRTAQQKAELKGTNTCVNDAMLRGSTSLKGTSVVTTGSAKKVKSHAGKKESQHQTLGAGASSGDASASSVVVIKKKRKETKIKDRLGDGRVGGGHFGARKENAEDTKTAEKQKARPRGMRNNKSPSRAREIANRLSRRQKVSRYQPWCFEHKKSESWPCTCNGMRVAVKNPPESNFGEGIMASELYEIEDGLAVVDVYFPKNDHLKLRKKSDADHHRLLDEDNIKHVVRRRSFLLERVPWHRIQLFEKLKIPLCKRRSTIKGRCYSEMLHNLFKAYKDRPCIGSKPDEMGVLPDEKLPHDLAEANSSSLANRFIWTTFQDSYHRALGCASVLASLGVKPGNFVGTCGENSKAYIEAQFGILLGNYVTVPLSTSLSDENTLHIISEAKISAAFVSQKYMKRYQQLFAELKKRDGQEIKLLLLTEETVGGWEKEFLPDIEEEEKKAEARRRQIRRRKREKKKGEKTPIGSKAAGDGISQTMKEKERSADDSNFADNDDDDIDRIEEDDIPDNSSPRIILYTSGSTGRPKGAIMSDSTLSKEVSGSLFKVEWNGSEVGIYDSPAAVSSSLYNMMAYLMNGGRVAVFADLTETFDVCEQIGPSSLGMVPQKWNVLFKRYQTRLVVGEKKEDLDKEFGKILGWRVTYLNCGGATPIPAVQDWLKKTYPKCKVTENYAATECGGITNSMEGDVGKIKEGVEVRLEDWGEYKTTDKPYPRGEICVRSDLRANGYLNRPDLTAQAWDKDGFYHTGDIGEMIDSTHIRIVDRKKNIFKLSTGEWVSPENVEKVFLEIEDIQQIFIHGTSRHSKVVALIVPAVKDVANDEAKEKKGTEFDEMKLRSKFQVLLKQSSKGTHLKHTEVPTAIGIVHTPFTLENQLLTQSGKLCRWKIRKEHKVLIESLLDEVLKEDERQANEQTERLGEVIKRAVEGKIQKGDESAWDEFQWNSSSVGLLQGMIRAIFKVKVPIAALGASLESLTDVATLVRRATAGESLEESPIDWKSEAMLPEEIRKLSQAGPVDEKHAPEAATILVTGVTGFLGTTLLNQLLMNIEKKDAIERIYCLARPKKNRKAASRVRNGLLKRGYGTEAFDSAIVSGKLMVMNGDLGQPKLGLMKSDYSILTRTVSRIIHAGSLVNHLWGYRQLKPANVLAVNEILKIALDPSGPIAEVHYVSTISVINSGDEKTVSPVRSLDSLGGYAQSKWVAEARIRAASAGGRIKCVIHRPGLIGPDTQNGSANTTDWLIRFISGVIIIGGYRILGDSKSHMIEITPVDHAAATILEVTRPKTLNAAVQRFTEYGKVHADVVCPVVHIPITKVTSTKILMEIISQSPELMGRRVRVLPLGEWMTTLSELPRNNPLFPFKESFLHGLGSVPAHEHKITNSILTEANNALSSRLSLNEPTAYEKSELDKMVRYVMAANKLTADRPLLMRTQSVQKSQGEELIHMTLPKMLAGLARSKSVDPAEAWKTQFLFGE